METELRQDIEYFGKQDGIPLASDLRRKGERSGGAGRRVQMNELVLGTNLDGGAVV